MAKLYKNKININFCKKGYEKSKDLNKKNVYIHVI